MQKIITNKYPGSCKSCGHHVVGGAGHAFRNGGGRWHVLCRSVACAIAVGIDVRRAEREAKAGLDVQRVVRPAGIHLIVELPFDRSALPLLRSLPDARWNPNLKAWTCSAAIPDRRRVLEIADKLKCEVDPSLREVHDPSVEAAKARAAATPRIRPYQAEGAAWLAGRKQALLGDDMGLGKTLQVLVALDEGARCIAIVPKSVKFTWRDEAELWRPDLKVTPLSGRGSFRVPQPGEVVTTNFDILPTIEKIEKLDLDGVTLVVDEAQGCKNHKAQRSKKVQALAKQCSRTWLMTGTPLMNKPPDLYGLLQAGDMAHRAFGSFKRFAERMGGDRGRFGYEWPDYEKTPDAIAPEVPEMLKRVMLRRTKADVLPDLPGKIRSVLHVNGENKVLRCKLDELWAKWRADIDQGCLPPFEAIAEVRAELAEARIPAVLEQVESYEDAGIPLVLFSAHRAPIDAFLAREGWGVITGDTTAEIRAEIVKNFQAGRLKGVALTIAAGGVGITLTHASHVLFVDWAWRPADLSQAEDRCCRIGQTADAVQIISMVQDHPFDQALHKLIRSKQAMIDQAVETAYGYDAPAADTTEAKQEPISLFDDETEEQRLARIAERDAKRKAAAERLEREAHTNKVELVIARHRGRGFSRSPADLTDEIREQIVGAHAYLLSVCDGAKSRDYQGFNAADAATARMVALFNFSNDNDLVALWGIVYKYRGQIEGNFPALY